MAPTAVERAAVGVVRDKGSEGRVTVRQVLVLSTNAYLGDVLCARPLLGAVKKRFQQAHVTLLAPPASYPFDPRSVSPEIDEWLPFAYRSANPGAVLRLGRELRARRFEVAIVPSTFSTSRTLHVLSYLSRAPVRAGIRRKNGVRNLAAFLLTVTGEFDWTRRHQIDRHLDVGGLVGCRLSASELAAVRLPVGEAEDREAELLLSGGSGTRARTVVGIHAGARDGRQVWPPENFAVLARKLREAHRCDVLLTCGPMDGPVVALIRGRLAALGVEHRVAPPVSAAVLAAVVRRLGLYVTLDTGAMHVGHFAGARMVAIARTSQVDAWCYRGQREATVHASRVADIPVDEVFSACDRMLRSCVRP